MPGKEKEMKVIDTYNALVGSVVAVLTYIFGEHWLLFALFLGFNVADWLTGWMKSRMMHKENSLVGWKGGLLFALFLGFNVADWLTGWMKSRMMHKENSLVGWKGVLKKLGYWLMIAVAFGASAVFSSLLGWFVLASLMVNEIRSICENFVEAGFDVPHVLVKGLEVADKVINKDSEGE